MKTMLLIAGAALIAMSFLAALATAAKRAGQRNGTIKSRAPVTKYEQPMYFRLREAFPDDIVLAQVAFSALLTTRDRATRNTFDRKVTDFVLCDKAFQVKAIIELDDSSHHGREAVDMKREALLTQAGYRVLRFKRVPDIEVVKKALADAISPTERIEPKMAPSEVTTTPPRQR